MDVPALILGVTVPRSHVVQPLSTQASAQAGVPAVQIDTLERRFAFIHASWHEDIVQQARAGFTAEMLRLGVPSNLIDVFKVPGAFELPLHAKKLARSGAYDAIVACALVVDGGIYRHDFVADAVVNGLMAVQLETEVPVLSVVLTPHHFQPHAEHQAFYSEHFVRKGIEAASACVLTVNALRRLGARPQHSGPDDDGGPPDTIQ